MKKLVIIAQVLTLSFLSFAEVPSGYQQIEFFESTGTQHINTGVRPSAGITIEVRYQLTETGTDSNWRNYIFGASAGNAARLQFSYQGGGKAFLGFGSEYDNSTVDMVADAEKIHTVEYRDGGFFLDGNLLKEMNTWGGTACDLYLFCMNNQGTPDRLSKSRIFACRIWCNGCLMRDYVPVKYVVTGESGLFDQVEGLFYDGTGKVVSSREECCAAKYIEATGVQYIDTGYVPNAKTAIEVHYQLTELSDDESWRNYIFGVNGTGALGRFQYTYMGGGKVFLGYGANYNNEQTLEADKDRVHVVEYKDGAFYVDRKRFYELANWSGTSKNMYLFAYNADGVLSKMGKSRIYSCKIWEDGDLKRDFVPMQQGERYVLFDRVGKKYYDNANGSIGFSGGEMAIAPDAHGWEKFAYQSRIQFANCGVTGAVSNVPVKVTLSETSLPGFRYADCRDDSRGLGFALSSNGEWLDYDVERWDTDGESVVWVNVPKLASNTKIVMYWGLKEDEDRNIYRGQDVWKAGGYATVVHMNNKSGVDSAGGVRYSSVNDQTLSVLGPVGRGLQTFSADGGLALDCFENAPWVNALTATDFTISFWINVCQKENDWPYFMQWDRDDNQLGSGMYIAGSMGDAERGKSLGSGFYFVAQGKLSSSQSRMEEGAYRSEWSYDDNWMHYTMTARKLESGAYECCAYYNASLVQVATNELSAGVETLVTRPGGSTPLYLINAKGRAISIAMDEFRISTRARSPVEIEAEYEAMTRPGFIVFGPVEPAKSPVRGIVIFFM